MRNTSYRWFFCLTFLLYGCGDQFSTAPISSTNFYWELRLNYHAALLSLQPPHNTLQLHTTPYTAVGEGWQPEGMTPAQVDSLLTASPAEFVSRDSSKVLVSSTGLVTARAVQSGNVYVVAARKLGNSIHLDSALIRVADVASTPVLDTFRVQPRDGDSAKVASDRRSVFFSSFAEKSFMVTTKDEYGSTIAGIPIYFTSSNPFVATVKDRFAAAKSISIINPGEVVLRSETWVYGVAKRDSMVFIVGYPIAPTLVIFPSEMLRNDLEWHYGPGATVGFRNFSGMTAAQASLYGVAASNGVPIEIIFDDSLNVSAAVSISQNSGGGNIRGGIPGDTAPFPDAGRIRYRRFISPGSYVYRILPFNTTGKIIIHDK